MLITLAKTCPSKATMPTLKSSAVDSIPSMCDCVLFGFFGMFCAFSYVVVCVERLDFYS